MIDIETLTVIRSWDSAYSQISTLLDKNGKVKEVITSSIRQPKKGIKEIVITKLGKSKTYSLDWSKVK